MYKFFLKRFIDIIFSLIGIILLFPLFIVLSFLVLIFMGCPIFFVQERVGKNNKIFKMVKFRTMTNEKDKDGNLLPNEKRLKKFGKFLRGTSLDELPELFNILIGDLSIIGPRPLLVKYLPYYSEYEIQRHKVRGGLIPPEVLYENIMPTWEEQFGYEVEYALNINFKTDLKILFAVFKGLFKRKKSNYGEYFREDLNVLRGEKK